MDFENRESSYEREGGDKYNKQAQIMTQGIGYNEKTKAEKNS